MPTRRLSLCLMTLLLTVHSHWPAHSGQPETLQPAPWQAVVRAAMETSEWVRAADWLKEYMKQSADPDVAYAYLYCLYQDGRYIDVLSKLNKERFSIVAAQKRGWLLAGLAQWHLKDLRGAFTSWATVLATSPKDDLAWECIRVGILSAPRLERKELVQNLLTALAGQRFPQMRFAEGFCTGILYMVRGDLELAEKNLKEAGSFFPESRAVATALLDFYRHQGNLEAAEGIGGERTQVSSRTNATDKSNNSNLVQPSVLSTGQPLPYRLPWPAGRTIFCASHDGRRETPHRDRGQYALDFLLPVGTPVLAARGGMVTKTSDANPVFGNREFATFVIIDHGDGTLGRYYHLVGGMIAVRPGQRVQQGQPLGQSGRTGRCQARLLHFDVVRKTSWSLGVPGIYSRWETLPVDFEETRNLSIEAVPKCWLVSANGRG